VGGHVDLIESTRIPMSNCFSAQPLAFKYPSNSIGICERPPPGAVMALLRSLNA
jgi:hypothetical protein